MATFSPAFTVASTAAIMASVEPQVTTSSEFGSTFCPEKCSILAAIASRRFCAPQVIAYWCGPVVATCAKRSVSSLGGSKSGKPWERLIASYCRHTRVIRRITESVKVAVRRAACMICLQKSVVVLFFFWLLPSQWHHNAVEIAKSKRHGK